MAGQKFVSGSLEALKFRTNAPANQSGESLLPHMPSSLSHCSLCDLSVTVEIEGESIAGLFD